MILYSTAALCLGLLLDALLGDPQGWPHIIRAFGWLIASLEKILYPMQNKRLGGTLLVIAVLTLCAGIPAAILFGAWCLSPWVYLVLEALLCWQLLAARSLQVESKKVYTALETGTLDDARYAVSMIVGRDTACLDEAGVTRAAVETVAENTSDGVAAPLFYLCFGGAVLGCLYKAANTMDSMVGYKNDRYLDFGRTAAKLDDVLNYLPARLCAIVMVAASALCGMDAKNAWRIWRRDRRNHASPNSAQTESVMAGALDLRLAGDAYYFGKLHKKPFIGDDLRPIARKDILRSHTLMFATTALLAVLALIIRGIAYAAL